MNSIKVRKWTGSPLKCNIRSVDIDGITYFVVVDFLYQIGFSRLTTPASATETIDSKDRLVVHDIPRTKGRLGTTCLSIDGMRTFLHRSVKPLALVLLKWFEQSVFPVLECSGKNVVKIDTLDTNAVRTAVKHDMQEQSEIERLQSILKKQGELIEQQRHEIAELRMMIQSNCLSFPDMAQELSMTTGQFVALLLMDDYIFCNMDYRVIPYAHYMVESSKTRYFMESQRINGTDHEYMITLLGQQFFKQQYGQKDAPPPEAGGTITVADELGNDVNIT